MQLFLISWDIEYLCFARHSAKRFVCILLVNFQQFYLSSCPMMNLKFRTISTSAYSFIIHSQDLNLSLSNFHKLNQILSCQSPKISPSHFCPSSLLLVSWKPASSLILQHSVDLLQVVLSVYIVLVSMNSAFEYYTMQRWENLNQLNKTLNVI